MKSQFINDFDKDSSNILPLDMQLNVLFEIVKKVLDEKTIRARVIKFKLQDYIDSNDEYRRLYALNKIISDGKGIEIIPDEKNVFEALEDTHKWISEGLAKKYVQNNIWMK